MQSGGPLAARRSERHWSCGRLAAAGLPLEPAAALVISGRRHASGA